MRRTAFLVLILSAIILFSCREDALLGPTEELIVVEAFLYAHEPVDDIHLTLMLPLDAEEGVQALTVNDASVRLVKDGQSYALMPTGGDSGYYHYAGSDLTVEADDRFTLEIDYKGELTTAETIVPTAPENVALSDATMRVPTLEDIRFGGLDVSDLSITVNWQNEEGNLFYVTVENIDANPTPVNSALRDFVRSRRFPPTSRDEFRLGFQQFTHFGTHLVKVYRVNREYADLYETQEQDSRSLNEPLSNIENSLGIFSAFHSNVDSLFLEVVVY